MTPCQQLHRAALKLRLSKSIAQCAGICSNLDYPDADKDEIALLLKSIFRRWPLFSGDVNWPVPSFNKKSAQKHYYAALDKWSRRTEYGRARWALLDFIIQETKESDDESAVD